MDSRLTQALLAAILIVLAYIAVVPKGTDRAAEIQMKRDAWDSAVRAACANEWPEIGDFSHGKLQVWVAIRELDCFKGEPSP